MIEWQEVYPEINPAKPAGQDKPWRVTRYMAHWYWGTRVGPVYVADFRKYWQANAASFIYHHLFGWSCNTWKLGSNASTTRQF